jgi:DNA-binding transcriptional LysR family regulator
VHWSQLQNEPLIILARREGVGLHDRILTRCHEAGFSPLLSHTPSVIGAVLIYAEAGTGVGVVPDSMESLDSRHQLTFKPLHPLATVELVMVWADTERNPAAQAFRNLVQEWLKKDLLWLRDEPAADQSPTSVPVVTPS